MSILGPLGRCFSLTNRPLTTAIDTVMDSQRFSDSPKRKRKPTLEFLNPWISGRFRFDPKQFNMVSSSKSTKSMFSSEESLSRGSATPETSSLVKIFTYVFAVVSIVLGIGVAWLLFSA